MRLQSKWTQHLRDPIEREKFTQLILNDRVILERLFVIIEELEAELEQSDAQISEYTNAAWPYLKADRIGEKRGYQKIKNLLNFLKE